MLPIVRRCRLPNLAGKVVGGLVLSGALHKGRNAITDRAIGAGDVEFEQLFVDESVLG